jgi:RimJ/RimL family protein N-acetyltransferase
MPHRVRLRPFSPGDAQDLAALCAHPESGHWLPPGWQPFDLDAAGRYIREAMHDFDSGCSIAFAIENTSNQQLMGEIRLNLAGSTLGDSSGLLGTVRLVAPASGHLRDLSRAAQSFREGESIRRVSG